MPVAWRCLPPPHASAAQSCPRRKVNVPVRNADGEQPNLDSPPSRGLWRPAGVVPGSAPGGWIGRSTTHRTPPSDPLRLLSGKTSGGSHLGFEPLPQPSFLSDPMDPPGVRSAWKVTRSPRVKQIPTGSGRPRSVWPFSRRTLTLARCGGNVADLPPRSLMTFAAGLCTWTT